MTCLCKHSLCYKTIGSAFKIKSVLTVNYIWLKFIAENQHFETARNSQELESYHTTISILVPVHPFNLILLLNELASILLWKIFSVVRSLRTNNTWPVNNNIIPFEKNWWLKTQPGDKLMRFFLSSRHNGMEFIYLMHLSKQAWITALSSFFGMGTTKTTTKNTLRECTQPYQRLILMFTALKCCLCIMDNESLHEKFANFCTWRPLNWQPFCTRVPYLNRILLLMFYYSKYMELIIKTLWALC